VLRSHLKAAEWNTDDCRMRARSQWQVRYVLVGTTLAAILGWVVAVLVAAATGHAGPTIEMLLGGTGALLALVSLAIQFRTGETLSATLTQARTDDLTGLGNRRMLLDTLNKRLTGATSPTGLILMDLDRFKEVNDSMGHEMGDELLKQIRPRLESILGPDQFPCRLGGDEFAVVLGLPNGPAPDKLLAEASILADRLRESMQKPFALGHTDIFLDASFGVALAPLHATSAEGLLRLADIAMYDAKRNRQGVSVYRPGLESANNHRLALANDLRTALRRSNEILTYFQPKIDLRTERVVGVEALVRWYHPTRGIVPPDEFLGIAEDTGQAALLTATVLERAMAQASDWAADGIDLKVAVNLYESDLRSPAIVERIAAVLEQHVLPPRTLQVEVTEQSLVADPAGTRNVLNQLHALGVEISLDDYGTGYSSLAYLREFPIDELKLDKTFAMGMLRDQTNWIIVRSTIELAHALDMRIVAEGVEDDLVRDELLTLGCDIGQGFFWSRPLAAHELDRWLLTRGVQGFHARAEH
jgi:diguanylate cyclase